MKLGNCLPSEIFISLLLRHRVVFVSECLGSVFVILFGILGAFEGFESNGKS